MLLKEKTAKDSIRKEQEIMQIESGSVENEALQKKYSFGLKFAVSRKLKIWKTQTPQNLENSDLGNSDSPKKSD